MTHNWFVGVQREIRLGHRGRRELRRLGRPRTCTTPTTSTASSATCYDGRFDGFNPSFSSINMVHVELARRTITAATLQLRRNFQQGFMLQGAYTFGKAMNDADVAVGATAFQDAGEHRRRLRDRRLRRPAQALARGAVGDAVLPATAAG